MDEINYAVHHFCSILNLGSRKRLLLSLAQTQSYGSEIHTNFFFYPDVRSMVRRAMALAKSCDLE